MAWELRTQVLEICMKVINAVIIITSLFLLKAQFGSLVGVFFFLAMKPPLHHILFVYLKTHTPTPQSTHAELKWHHRVREIPAAVTLVAFKTAPGHLTVSGVPGGRSYAGAVWGKPFSLLRLVIRGSPIKKKKTNCVMLERKHKLTIFAFHVIAGQPHFITLVSSDTTLAGM